MLPSRNSGRNQEIMLDIGFPNSNKTRHQARRVQNEVLALKRKKKKWLKIKWPKATCSCYFDLDSQIF